MGREVLECDHGIDLMWPCFECESEAGRIAKEYDMQVSGTFPQLNDKKPKGGRTMGKGKSSSKGKGGKGC